MKTSFALFVAAFVVFGLVALAAPTPVQAEPGWCNATENNACAADCAVHTPAECVFVSGTCYYDSITHAVACGCNYTCMISPHRPDDTGFKHLELIHESN